MFKGYAAKFIGVGLLVIALLAAGLGSVPDAEAANRTPVRAEPILSENELLAWWNSAKPSTICNDSEWINGVWTCNERVAYEFRAADGDVTPRGLIRRYLEEGKKEGITGDVAFMQGILETGWFYYPDSGQVRPWHNNFAGMGAFDSGTHAPFHFPGPRTGVRAQMQHLRLYADPYTATNGSNLGSSLAVDVDGRYPDRWRIVRNMTLNGEPRFAGRAQNWEDFGDGMWATDPIYGAKILNLYKQALTFNGYAETAATLSGRGCMPAVTTGDAAGATSEYVPLRPRRILDTRNSIGGPANRFGQRETRSVKVTGSAGVPSSGVDAVVINVNAREPSRATYLTVWPTGNTRRDLATLHTKPGDDSANEIVAKVGSNGSVNIYNRRGTTDVTLDVVGYVPSSSDYVSLRPRRILDTRNNTGGPASEFGERETRSVKVTGVGGVPSSGVDAVRLNVNARHPSADTYLTVWPTGNTRRDLATVHGGHLRAGANEITAKVGSNGSVNIYNRWGSTDVTVDVVGYVPSSSNYVSLRPRRVVDSRSGTGDVFRAIGARSACSVRVAGVAGVPADASAVVVNVNARQPTRDTYLTVWPSGHGRRDLATLHAGPGRDAANEVVAQVGVDGRINIYNRWGRSDVTVDIVGYYR